MRHFFRALVLGGCLAAAPFVGAAYAGVLFDNIGLKVTGGDAVANTLYASFTTGPQGVDLSAVSLELIALQPLDGGSLNVFLAIDSGGAPGKSIAKLGTISDSALNSTIFTPSIMSLPGSKSLAANTRYWLKLATNGVSTSSSAYWAYDSSSNGVSVASELDLNAANGTGVTLNSAANSVYLMSVTGIPEPGTLSVLLFGVALTTLALGLRKPA